MNKPTPFFRWVWNTQRKRIIFIHVILALCAWALATDIPQYPWDVVGWILVQLPFAGYWTGNYWYWFARLKKGTVK